MAIQNEKIQSFASCSIDNCRYYTPIQRSQLNNFVEHTNLDRRIDALKKFREDTAVKIPAERHICSDCELPKDDCVKCDICGTWTCPECSVTTLDNRVLCEECYNYEDKTDLSYVTEV